MRSGSLALAALCLAGPAHAQDGSEGSSQRTVEGAQQFLNEFYTAHLASARVMTFPKGSAWYVDYASLGPGRANSLRNARAGVESFKPEGRCKSALGLTNLRATKDIAGQQFGEMLAPGPALTAAVDWSKVDRVEVGPEMIRDADGTGEIGTGEFFVMFGQPGWAAYMKTLHPSEEQAKRAAFAMQFLVEQCGFKTETGF